FSPVGCLVEQPESSITPSIAANKTLIYIKPILLSTLKSRQLAFQKQFNTMGYRILLPLRSQASNVRS
ncbi:MAG: hypothetical protein ACWGO1_13850, partial [Anaerolineales bacterium]